MMIITVRLVALILRLLIWYRFIKTACLLKQMTVVQLQFLMTMTALYNNNKKNDNYWYQVGQICGNIEPLNSNVFHNIFNFTPKLYETFFCESLPRCYRSPITFDVILISLLYREVYNSF